MLKSALFQRRRTRRKTSAALAGRTGAGVACVQAAAARPPPPPPAPAPAPARQLTPSGPSGMCRPPPPPCPCACTSPPLFPCPWACPNHRQLTPGAVWDVGLAVVAHQGTVGVRHHQGVEVRVARPLEEGDCGAWARGQGWRAGGARGRAARWRHGRMHCPAKAQALQSVCLLTGSAAAAPRPATHWAAPPPAPLPAWQSAR